MNDYQEERHASNKLVVKIARENPAIIKLIPDFESGINMQDEINKEVEKISTQQEKDTSAITENKRFTIKKLLSQTLEVSGAVHAYASKKKDILLMGKVNFKVGALSNMSAGKLISVANTSLEEAQRVPAKDLALAGISASELAAYKEMVDYFKNISNSPREAQIETSVYTKRLAELIKASTKLYKESLDRLALQFKSKAPEFYQKYRSARKSIRRTTETPAEV